MRWLRNASTVLVLATAGILLGPVTPACACSCAGGTAEELFAGSEVVFRGVVSKIDEPLFAGNSGAPVRVTLTVSEVFKGTVTSRMTVTTSADGASCGYEFVAGRQYVVLASTYDGTVTTGLCSGNRDVEKEGNPYAGGSDPLPGGPADGWTVRSVATATAGVVAGGLALGAILWFWRRRLRPQPTP
jgi:hypothetical protein